MLIAGVIDDQVEDDSDTPIVQAFDQIVHVIQGTVWRVDILVIAYIVAHVHLRTSIMRRKPNYIDAQLLDIVKLRDDPGDIAKTVAIAVFERSWPLNITFVSPSKAN